MTAPAGRLSIEDAARWTFAFLAREWRLIVPVALAFIALPQVALQLLAPPLPAPDLATGRPPQLHPWMLWLLPVILLGVYGQVAISVLALAPGLSVGEALRRALGRSAKLLLAILMLTAALVVILVLIGLAGTIAFRAAPAGGPMLRATVNGATFLLMFACWFRFVLLLPLVAARDAGPVAAIRGAFVLSRGRFWRLVLAFLPVMFAWLVITAVARIAFGSVILLIGRLSGGVDVAAALNELAFGILSGLLVAVVTILTAALYRQANGASSGI